MDFCWGRDIPSRGSFPNPLVEVATGNYTYAGPSLIPLLLHYSQPTLAVHSHGDYSTRCSRKSKATVGFLCACTHYGDVAGQSRSLAITWLCTLARMSSRPVDTISSIMNMVGVILDPRIFDKYAYVPRPCSPVLYCGGACARMPAGSDKPYASIHPYNLYEHHTSPILGRIPASSPYTGLFVWITLPNVDCTSWIDGLHRIPETPGMQ